MRKYALIAFLLLNGCVRRPTDVYEASPLRFRFGENVYVAEGFYRGCKGWISGHHEDGVGNHYYVNSECAIKSDTTVSVILDAKESELVEDASN